MNGPWLIDWWTDWTAWAEAIAFALGAFLTYHALEWANERRKRDKG